MVERPSRPHPAIASGTNANQPAIPSPETVPDAHGAQPADDQATTSPAATHEPFPDLSQHPS